MVITICNQCGEERWDECRADFEAVLRRTAERTQMQEDACVSVIFVTPEQIHAINRDYRGIDRPTDVISFALHDTMEEYEMPGGEEAELGDIFINVQAVKTQAEEYGHSQRREVCFLFTHGLLHLLGYDHMEEADEKVMFSLQDEILDELVKREAAA